MIILNPDRGNIMKLEHLRKDEAIRYLGYGENKPDDNILNLLDACERELLQVIVPEYIYKIFDIEKIDREKEKVTFKDCALELTGKDITAHLKGCERAVFIACTVSVGVDKLLRITQLKDMTKAFVMDSLASAAIEQVCDMAQEEIMKNTKGYGTWRFSCGYGDLPIECQKLFVTVLDAQKRIGLNVTESYLLTPTKSVTAVFGLSKEKIEKKRLGCESCNMKDKCEFRKRGERCGS